MQSGQALGQLGQVQQGMGTQGLQTLSTLGAQEQALGQRVLDQPMQQAQQYAKLLQGYAIPTTATKQTVGSKGYSNSPLSQIGGLLALLTSYRGQGDGTTTEDQSTLSKIGQGVNVATGVKKLAGYADGGMVSPDVAYTDVDGNMYDANGTMVG
jgi:hypothetical protein